MTVRTAPSLRIVSETARSFEVAVDLDAAYAGFDGHFPGDPVLPGMCQIDLAQRAASVALRRELVLERVEKARFLVKVRPGDDLRIHLLVEASDGSLVLRARHTVGGTTVAEIALRAR